MTLFLAAALLDATLKLDLTPGKVYAYEVTRDYRSVEEREQTGFVDRVWYTVERDRSDDKAVVTVRHLPLRTVLDGQTIPAPAKSEPLVLHEKRAANGTVFEREAFPYEPTIRERQLRATDVRFPSDPVAKGTVWARDVPELKGDGLPPAHWEWTCTDFDATTLSLGVKFDERDTPQPIHGDGTIVVDLATGWMVSADLTLHNTVVPGDSEHVVVDLHFVWRKA